MMAGTTSPTRLSASGYALLWTGLWLAVMAAALKFRPLMAVDETRYLAVAWEMWRDGNFLVPHLNGEPYSHKPPLLFWLMHAGWAVFGVNDWWPRLVAPLFGLSNLFLTAILARRLWPGRPVVAVAAPLILFACLFWTLFTTLTMFDMLLAFCALLAMLGIIRAWQDDSADGFIWLALAIGIGALAKGPAILLSTLPVALLAPLWAANFASKEKEAEIDGVELEPAQEPRMWSKGWIQWYKSIGFAVLGGVAIGLIWALPAAIMGGEEYRNAIFWGQSAGRMVDSFAHGRPWWWFLAVLPGLVLPWTVWPACWRSIRGLLDIREDNAIRFCLLWFLPALIAFSAISGKQLHYLLPVFPALALIGGRLLTAPYGADNVDIKETSWKRSGLQIPATLFIVVGLILGLAPLTTGIFDLPPIVAEVDFIWGLGLALFSFAVMILTRSGIGLIGRLATMSILSMALVLTVHLSLAPPLTQRFDLTPISQKLSDWQRAGIEISYHGKYHGQFNFLGRLEKPITAIGLLAPDVENWIAENPEGYIITVIDQVLENVPPIFSQPYRGRFLIVIKVEQAIANPTLLEES